MQAVLAVQFLVAGMLKVIGDPQMIDMFAQIGAGQWFRLAVGAVLTNVVLLQTSPALPVMFLLLGVLVTAVRRHEIRELSATVAAARADAGRRPSSSGRSARTAPPTPAPGNGRVAATSRR